MHTQTSTQKSNNTGNDKVRFVISAWGPNALENQRK